MSRNIRRKAPATAPRKATKRRASDTSTSSFDLSGEEGYSAVEDISDSEDDDEDDVDAAEEENIVTEALPVVSPRPRTPTSDFGNDAEDEADAEESTSWAGIPSENEESNVSDFFQEASAFTEQAIERHVHFDVPSSDSESTETEDDHADMFPDIFVSQSSLDPNFRREIEKDNNESSGSESFWDFNGGADSSDSEAEEVVRQLSDEEATPRAVSEAALSEFTPVPAFQEPQELDGYETDGDTTEEDIPVPSKKKPHRPLVHLSDDSDSEGSVAAKRQQGQPRVGRFRLDRSDRKPIGVLNPLTGKMMIFTPGRRHQLDLSPEQFNIPWEMEEQSSPVLSNPANMMLSAMWPTNTFGDFANTPTIGPAEAFFPFVDGTMTVGSSSGASFMGSGDEDEKKLDVDDFIEWDSSSADEQDEGNWEPSSTPARPSTATSEREVLSHLNSETVGAFRRNQINQQLLLSNQATQDSLAFSGPYNFTALRGLKSDRFQSAGGAPLTPARRHKRSSTDFTRSPLESFSNKRKASNDVSNGHKRHRSISDVNSLHI